MLRKINCLPKSGQRLEQNFKIMVQNILQAKKRNKISYRTQKIINAAIMPFRLLFRHFL